MELLKNLSRGMLVCIGISVLIGPWFFGSWEMWWFWPFVVPIFVALLLFGLRLIVASRARKVGDIADPDGGRSEALPGAFSPNNLRLLLSAVPFLLYAFIRFLGAPVYIDAERSFLLFFTALLLVIMVVFGLESSERRWLFMAICVNLLLIGLYGWVNHKLTGSHLVLWADGYAQYTNENRASGCYFCPDHYSGIMEIAVCLGLGLVLGGGMQFYERLGGGAMVVLGTVGVVMSRSRGGGMTLIVILVAAAIWGLTHLPREARWWWRLSACAFVLMLILLLANLAEPYMTRFGSYFGWQQFRGRPASEAFDAMQKRTMGHSRPHMFVAAYRAWKTAPWLGIGPGMHDALWPHFAPSADGDRATGKWPTYLNNSHTSNEVHNDWLELLEEYGLVGFALFLLPFSLLIRDYHRGLKQDARRARIREIMYEDDSDPWKDAVVLGVFLAILAMSFHSLGDFNLQIPATTWIMATLVGLGLSAMWQAPSPGQAS